MRHNLIILMALFSWTHCLADEATSELVKTVSGIAFHIYDQDHSHYNLDLQDHFSKHELELIRSNKESFLKMVKSALSQGNSIWGAKIAALIGDKTLIPYLQDKVYLPQRCYGWEGPDYSDPESYLQDNQFQYSSVYIDALTSLSGLPLAKAAPPSETQQRIILRHAENPESEHHHWAVWISRKMNGN